MNALGRWSFLAVGVTGSGRERIGRLIGADRRAAILPAYYKIFTTTGRLLQDKNVQNGIEK